MPRSNDLPPSIKPISHKVDAVSRATSHIGTRPAKKSKARLPAPALTTSRKELLVDGSDHAFRQLVHTLLAFHARHETVRAGHANVIGLAGIEYNVLSSVNDLASAGDVSVRELAAYLHLSGAFITTVSNKLQQMGLLDKRVDPADRRRLRLTVTAQGAELLASLTPAQCQANDVQFDCLSAADFQQLLGSVARLVDSSERAIALQRYLLPEGRDLVPKTAASAMPVRGRKS